MRKNLFQKLKNKKGYTLTEMIVVVGIIVILLGISMLGVAELSKNLKMAELDDYAKIIYLEAQEQLSLIEVEGGTDAYYEQIRSTYPKIPEGEAGYNPRFFKEEIYAVDEYVSDYPLGSTDAEKVLAKKMWEHMCYLTKSDGLSKKMIFETSDIYLNGGSYLIEFNPRTGDIYGVFYWENSADMSYKNDIMTLTSRERAVRKAKQIGYYGGELAGDFTEEEDILQKVSLINGEELYLKISFDKEEGVKALDPSNPRLSVSVEITGERNNTVTFNAIDLTKNSESTTSETLDFYVLLDSMIDGYHFNNIVNAGKTGDEQVITPGENLTIKVTSTFKDAVTGEIKKSVKNVIGNSLFANVTNGEQIGISALRHMMNLRSAVYDGDRFPNRNVIQYISNVDFAEDAYSWDWNDTKNEVIYKQYGLADHPLEYINPIENEKVFKKSTNPTIDDENRKVTSNGDDVRYVLKNFIVEPVKNAEGTVSDNTGIGIFGEIKNTDFSNLYVENATVNAEGCDNVGALIGRLENGGVIDCGVYLETSGVLDGESTVTDYPTKLETDACHKYLMEHYYDNFRVKGNNNVGGLIGKAEANTAVIIKNSFAATKVDGASYVGGLIGYVETTNDAGVYVIKQSYASGDVSGQNYVGGFAGGIKSVSSGKIAVTDNYATGNVYGEQKFAGFIGKTTNADYKKCIAYGEILKKGSTQTTKIALQDSDMAGGFVYDGTDTNVGSSYTESCYMAQMGYNKSTALKNPAAIPEKEYSTLVAQEKDLEGRLKDAVSISYPYANILYMQSFPFKKLEEQKVHYGDWAKQFVIDTSLVYYEKYADGKYGYYCVLTASGNDKLWLLDTLRDETCIEDGYGLMTKYKLNKISYDVYVGNTGEALKGTNVPVVERTDQMEGKEYDENQFVYLKQEGSLTFKEIESYDAAEGKVTGDETGATFEGKALYLYQLPYELQYADRDGKPYFYDRIVFNATADGGSNKKVIENVAYLYNPHFAKTAYNPNVSRTVVDITTTTAVPNPKNVYIRSARQLNSLGRYPYYWNTRHGFNTGQQVNYLQETDVNFSTYTKVYGGRKVDLQAFGQEYSNRPIGNSELSAVGEAKYAGAFKNNYDGQSNKIIDYCVDVSDVQFVGLFGEIQGATLQNIVMVMSPETERRSVNAGLIRSDFKTWATYESDNPSAPNSVLRRRIMRTAVGALLGMAYDNSYSTSDNDISNTIRNCVSAGYTVQYHLSNEANPNKPDDRLSFDPMGIVVGGLIGYGESDITNCSAVNDVQVVLDKDYDNSFDYYTYDKNRTEKYQKNKDASKVAGGIVNVGGFVGSYFYNKVENCYSGGSIDIINNGNYTIPNLRIGNFCPGWLDTRAYGLNYRDYREKDPETFKSFQYVNCYTYTMVYDTVWDVKTNDMKYVPFASRHVDYYDEGLNTWNIAENNGFNANDDVKEIPEEYITFRDVYYLSDMAVEEKIKDETVFGTSVLWKDLTEVPEGKKANKATADNTYKYAYTKAGAAYPFQEVITEEQVDGNGNRTTEYVHYGDWYIPLRNTSLAYYEKYANGSYGYYCVTTKENGEGTWILDSLKDEVCIEDGYGLLTKYALDSLSAKKGDTTVVCPINETHKMSTEGAYLRFREYDNYDVLTAKAGNNLGLSVNANDLYCYLYKLPYELQDPGNPSSFYNKVTFDGEVSGTKVINGVECWYNPHFAKVAINPTKDQTIFANPTNIYVRSARQLNALGRNNYYWQLKAGTAKVSFVQETDINFSTYGGEEKIYLGKPFNLQTFDLNTEYDYRNKPIGQPGGGQFTNIYDGQSNLIIDYCVDGGTNTKLTGLFGEIFDAKLKNIVMVVSSDRKDKGGIITSSFRNKGIDRGCVGALLGMAYYGGNTIDNCAVSGYTVQYVLKGEKNTKDPLAVAIGGLAGFSMSSITNSSATNHVVMKLEKDYNNTVAANNAGVVYVGGFVGSQMYKTVENCYSGGTIDVDVLKDNGTDKWNLPKLRVGGFCPGWLDTNRGGIYENQYKEKTLEELKEKEEKVGYKNVYSYTKVSDSIWDVPGTSIIYVPLVSDLVDWYGKVNDKDNVWTQEHIEADKIIFDKDNNKYVESLSIGHLKKTPEDVKEYYMNDEGNFTAKGTSYTGLADSATVKVTQKDGNTNTFINGDLDSNGKLIPSETPYPYPAVIKKVDASGNITNEYVHYGEWLDGIDNTLAYYEKYSDTDYGYYSLVTDPITGTAWILDTLQDRVAIEDGYGLLTEYTLGSLSYDLYVANKGTAVPGTIDVSTLQSVSGLNFEVNDGAVRKVVSAKNLTKFYKLPAGLQFTERNSGDGFYDLIVFNAVESETGKEVITEFASLYNPHFAKAVINLEADAEDTTPTNVYVRSARQLNALGRYEYYWNLRGGKQGTKKVSYIQETDINFSTYVKEYLGTEMDLWATNRPIGASNPRTNTSQKLTKDQIVKRHFSNIYDGQSNRIIDYGVNGGRDTQYVGLFGAISGATLKNIVMLSSSNQEGMAGQIVSSYVTKHDYDVVEWNDHSVGMGALVGLAYELSKDADTKNIIENCAVSGYTVKYVLEDISNISGLKADIGPNIAKYSIMQPTSIVIGGLAGFSTSDMSNCTAVNDVILELHDDYLYTHNNYRLDWHYSGGVAYLGGFVGSYIDGTVESCYSGGKIDVNDNDHSVPQLRIAAFCPGWLDTGLVGVETVEEYKNFDAGTPSEKYKTLLNNCNITLEEYNELVAEYKQLAPKYGDLMKSYFVSLNPATGLRNESIMVEATQTLSRIREICQKIYSVFYSDKKTVYNNIYSYTTVSEDVWNVKAKRDLYITKENMGENAPSLAYKDFANQPTFTHYVPLVSTLLEYYTVRGNGEEWILNQSINRTEDTFTNNVYLAEVTDSHMSNVKSEDVKKQYTGTDGKNFTAVKKTFDEFASDANEEKSTPANTFINDFDEDGNLVTSSKKYPYRAVITDVKTGKTAHYGDWPDLVNLIDASLAYYEKYENGSYGYYSVTTDVDKETTWIIDTLKDEVCVEDGYGLLSKYLLDNLSYKRGPATDYTVADINKVEVSGLIKVTKYESYDSALAQGKNKKNESLDVAELYTYLYKLPYELQNRSETYTFYDTIYFNGKAGGQTLIEGVKCLYNPHFAKTALNMSDSKYNALLRPGNVYVRSARQLNALGRNKFYWALTGGTDNNQKVNFIQETDINFSTYVKTYLGQEFDLQDFEKDYANHVIGESYGTPFTNIYDGRSNRIIDYCLDGGETTHFTGLFGEIKNATLKNIVMVVSSNPKGKGGVITSSYRTRYNATGDGEGNWRKRENRVGLGALLGMANNDWGKNTIENCVASGYTVKYVLINRPDTIKPLDNFVLGNTIEPLGVAIGGLIGYSVDNISNCAAVNDVVVELEKDYIHTYDNYYNYNRNNGSGTGGVVYMGGFIGSFFYGKVNDCYSGGSIDIIDNGYRIPQLRVASFCPGWIDTAMNTLSYKDYEKNGQDYRSFEYVNVYSYTDISAHIWEVDTETTHYIPLVSRLVDYFDRGINNQDDDEKWIHNEMIPGIYAGFTNNYYLQEFSKDHLMQVEGDENEIPKKFYLQNGENAAAASQITRSDLKNKAESGIKANKTYLTGELAPSSTVSYPYPAVIREVDEKGNLTDTYVHYGDWYDRSVNTKLASKYPTYFEIYADGTYGFSYVDEAGITVNTLTKNHAQEITSTGYGYLTTSSKDANVDNVNITIGNTTYYLEKMEPNQMYNAAEAEQKEKYVHFKMTYYSAETGNALAENVDIYMNAYFGAALSGSSDLGTKENPFQVRTKEHFERVATLTRVNAKDSFIKQTHDVDLQGVYASSYEPTYEEFKLVKDNGITMLDYYMTYDGSYEELGCVIKNAAVTPFAINNGLIQNTKVDSYDSSAINRWSLSGFVFDNIGTIENCSVNATVIKADCAYGFVIFNAGSGVVRNCSVNGILTGTEEAVGFVADNRGMVEKCNVNATITARDTFGFAEMNRNGATIKECEATVNATATKNTDGNDRPEGNLSILDHNGLAAGFMEQNAGLVSGCKVYLDATHSISSNYIANGFAYINFGADRTKRKDEHGNTITDAEGNVQYDVEIKETGTIEDCHVVSDGNGSVEGRYAYGFVYKNPNLVVNGVAVDATINGCSVIGRILGDKEAAGFAGINEGEITLSKVGKADSNVITTVQAREPAGFVFENSGEVDECHVNANVESTTNEHRAFGFTYANKPGGQITDSSVTGTVKAKLAYGFVLKNNEDAAAGVTATIDNCSVNATVTGYGAENMGAKDDDGVEAAGFCDRNYPGGEIKNCSVLGTIQATMVAKDPFGEPFAQAYSEAVGFIDVNKGTVTSCTVGNSNQFVTVIGDDAAGFVEKNEDGASISGCSVVAKVTATGNGVADEHGDKNGTASGFAEHNKAATITSCTAYLVDRDGQPAIKGSREAYGFAEKNEGTISTSKVIATGNATIEGRDKAVGFVKDNGSENHKKNDDGITTEIVKKSGKIEGCKVGDIAQSGVITIQAHKAYGFTDVNFSGPSLTDCSKITKSSVIANVKAHTTCNELSCDTSETEAIGFVNYNYGNISECNVGNANYVVNVHAHRAYGFVTINYNVAEITSSSVIADVRGHSSCKTSGHSNCHVLGVEALGVERDHVTCNRANEKDDYEREATGFVRDNYGEISECKVGDKDNNALCIIEARDAYGFAEKNKDGGVIDGCKVFATIRGTNQVAGFIEENGEEGGDEGAVISDSTVYLKDSGDVPAIYCKKIASGFAIENIGTISACVVLNDGIGSIVGEDEADGFVRKNGKQETNDDETAVTKVTGVGKIINCNVGNKSNSEGMIIKGEKSYGFARENSSYLTDSKGNIIGDYSSISGCYVVAQIITTTTDENLEEKINAAQEKGKEYGKDTDAAYGMVGTNWGMVENCHVGDSTDTDKKVEILIKGSRAYGFSRENRATIKSCSVVGTGGTSIIATASADLSAGNEHFDTGCALGFVSDNYGTIEESYVRAMNAYEDVCVEGYYAYGFVNENDGTVDKCFIVAKIDAKKYAAGFVRSNNANTISNCYSNVKVTALKENDTQKASGFALESFGGKIRNCYACGSVSAGMTYGFVANATGGEVDSCYTIVEQDASKSYCAFTGFASDAKNAVKTNCYWGYDEISGYNTKILNHLHRSEKSEWKKTLENIQKLDTGKGEASPFNVYLGEKYPYPNYECPTHYGDWPVATVTNKEYSSKDLLRAGLYYCEEYTNPVTKEVTYGIYAVGDYVEEYEVTENGKKKTKQRRAIGTTVNTLMQADAETLEKYVTARYYGVYYHDPEECDCGTNHASGWFPDASFKFGENKTIKFKEISVEPWKPTGYENYKFCRMTTPVVSGGTFAEQAKTTIFYKNDTTGGGHADTNYDYLYDQLGDKNGITTDAERANGITFTITLDDIEKVRYNPKYGRPVR